MEVVEHMRGEMKEHGCEKAVSASWDRPHEKLEVYRLSHALALRVHRLTLKLPRYQEREEGGQVRRSSKSVSAQIVEGHALRQYKAEYIRYLVRAYGSAEETIEHLKYLEQTTESDFAAECHEIRNAYGNLCRKLYNYFRSVSRSHDPAWARVPLPRTS